MLYYKHVFAVKDILTKILIFVPGAEAPYTVIVTNQHLSAAHAGEA